MFDVLNATDFIVPALEILDTRIERVDPTTKATRKIFDTVADNAANAGIVLGGRPIKSLDADLRWIGALCFKNGQLEETVSPPACSTIPRLPSHGLPIRSRRKGLRSNLARSCSPAPSSVGSRLARATRSTPIMELTARSVVISAET